jgi:ethanolaminephosphotransferase
MLQTSSKNTTFFVWVTLIVSFIAYGRFVTLVIRDITNYLGIACFTVGKKGNGYSANSVQPDGNKQQ